MKLIELTVRTPRGKVPDSLHKNYKQSVQAGFRNDFIFSFKDKLSQLGWVKLGDGLYSIVYTNPRKSYVLKINKIFDSGFEAFAQFVKSHPNKHFPKIGDVKQVKYANERYYIYCIEKLYPITPLATAMKMADLIDNAFYDDPPKGPAFNFFQKQPNLLGAIKLLRNKFGASNDIHSGNIMQRKDGTIVITDPYAWY